MEVTMRQVRVARALPFWGVGADGYQEFRAGAILVRRVVPILDAAPLVLVEHQRGFQLAFDRHVDRLRGGEAPVVADYLATWLGMTGEPGGPPLVRLDLAVDGLRSRVRLLFKQRTSPARWLLVDGPQLGLQARPVKRILRRLGAPTPPWLELSRRARRRTLGQRRARAATGGAR